MIHTEEFNSGATLKYLDKIEMAERKNKEFWEKEWERVDELSKKHHICQCRSCKQQEEEPDEYKDNLENR